MVLGHFVGILGLKSRRLLVGWLVWGGINRIVSTGGSLNEARGGWEESMGVGGQGGALRGFCTGREGGSSGRPLPTLCTPQYVLPHCVVTPPPIHQPYTNPIHQPIPVFPYLMLKSLSMYNTKICPEGGWGGAWGHDPPPLPKLQDPLPHPSPSSCSGYFGDRDPPRGENCCPPLTRGSQCEWGVGERGQHSALWGRVGGG